MVDLPSVTSPSAAPLSGVWGTIASSAGRSRLAPALVDELLQGLRLLTNLPPAVTFFGGARIEPDDPYYHAAERIGALLARHGIPPRTGAGPGIMTAVPLGFVRELRAAGATNAPSPVEASADGESQGKAQALTQGVNIKLPFEQAINPAIDVSLELAHFPTRKLMLYANALGIVIFPGGFGTLDELFEVWRLKSARRLNHPFVVFGRDFWGPLAEVLHTSTLGTGRETVPPNTFALVTLSDDPEEALQMVLRDGHASHFDEPLDGLGSRIAHELVEGLEYLESLPPAVTVLGGSRLQRDDPAIAACEEIARLLAQSGVPTRAGGSGAFSVALARGGHRGAPYLPQQAFGMRRSDARNFYGADRLHLVNDRLTHKVLLTEGALAILSFPGGLGTLDEVSTVLCQLQTRKISPRPVVLFGSEFWQPLWSVLRAQMVAGPRKTIAEEDLQLVTITDDPAHAAELCLGAR